MQLNTQWQKRNHGEAFHGIHHLEQEIPDCETELSRKESSIHFDIYG